MTPKSIGNAVVRNLVRRRLRALTATSITELDQIDGVFRIHPKSATASFSELSEALISVLAKAKK